MMFFAVDMWLDIAQFSQPATVQLGSLRLGLDAKLEKGNSKSP